MNAYLLELTSMVNPAAAAASIKPLKSDSPINGKLEEMRK